ncbi:MAG TPA: tetratricopeptide repeat protein [Candidatus Angelobacter sp.]|jgi:tetratricopeptide (TPR) repeat protein
MKTKLTYVAMATFIFMLGASVAWSQATAGKIQGRVTNGGKPLASAEVTLTNTDNGKTYKMKTDKDGQFSAVGIQYGTYEQEVSDASGEKLFKTKVAITGEGGAVQNLSVEVASGKAGSGPSPEEMEKLKAERQKGLNMNVLINQYNTAQAAKNWQAAADALKQMITVEPNRWEYQQALGNMQSNLGQYDEAVETYEKVIPLAENATKTDPKADPAKAKAAVAQMLSSEGNAYQKLKQNDKAIAAYTKAASLDPNPGNSYFNLCVMQYNSGNAQGALPVCDKAIAADPNKADTYFIKGSLLMGDSKQGKDGKLEAPAGTAEAFNKYLELAPDGPHANDVKQMLAVIGAKVETTYKEKKKK